jgi:rare lipoprotein A
VTPGLLRTAGRAAAGGALLAGLVACASATRPKPQLPRAQDAVVPAPGTRQEGVASWYGPGYHGKRTSSGETFNQNDLTAAHFDWAFGTRVEVTLLSTGKSCVVRINDRFPNHKGRVIDVSRAAAASIGLIGPGTGRVRLEVVP